MMRQLLNLAVVAVAVAGGSLPAVAQETLKVAIGQISNWENQAPTLGQEVGIFKKHGLVLETLSTAGGGETMQPVISGAVDIGIGVGAAGIMRAFSTGAPVRILTPAFTGTGDTFWYVRADSPIKTLADATDKTTIAYSTNGSSTHSVVLAFVNELGVKAKPTATGSPAGTLTALMSGQIDIGWSSPPVALQEIRDGKVRMVARGSDAPSLRAQTMRVTIVNAETLRRRPEAVARFVAAYREALDWMYSDPKALELYAKKINKPLELVKYTVDQFYPKSALQTDQMADIDGIVRDAVKLKFLKEPLSKEQLTELVWIPPRQ